MPWYRKLHWQIIVGLALGVLYGILASLSGFGDFTNDWVAPFGTIFINLLKLVAVPLVITSLIGGVASLSDLGRLSRIGGKTIAIYLGTTVIAVSLGLVLVNVLRPGYSVPPEMRERLEESYRADADSSAGLAHATREQGPLQPIVDMVPDNLFGAASDNRNMLQIVFVSLLIGIGLIQIPASKSQPIVELIHGLNEVVIRLVDLVMLMAPLGVFALIASTITTVAGDQPSQVIELLGALAYYCIAVVAGLALHTLVTYSSLIHFFGATTLGTFFKAMAPAQLVAFSTSSSGATLPVTMERCREKLGVSEEITSFVLPLGATINMDGTALYQAVAAVFIAQSIGMELAWSAQLTIILTAVLASIGTAAVPSAGIIMLVIILEAVGVPSAGIAMILGVDRILDMLRTVTNVTGDAMVAVLVATSEGQMGAADLSEESDHIRLRASDD